MPTFTRPDGTPYSSALMPIDTRTLTIKRGDGSTAGGGTGTSLGTYLAESFSVTAPGKLIERTGVSGEAKDMAIVRGRRTCSCKLQVATALGQATPIAGDYFEESVDVVITTLVAAGTTRFVITDCSKDETAGNPHTYNVTAVEDIENSPKFTV